MRPHRFYVPDTLRSYYRDPIRLSNAPFFIVSLIAAVSLFHLWGIAVAAVAILLSVAIRLWGEAESLDRRIRELEPLEASRDELEQDVARLEDVVSELRRQRERPSLPLPLLVHALDGQIEEINLVRKHRRLALDGPADWPVTSVSVVNETDYLFSAHADEAVRYANEPVAVIEVSTAQPVGLGKAMPSGETRLDVVVKFTALPDGLQEQAYGDHGLYPGAFRLRLAGLEVRHFSDMPDEELETLLASLEQSVAVSSAALKPPPPQLEAPDA